jgi:hypothetical protein
MAYFKYPKFFTQRSHQAFDTTSNPGQLTAYSGIYRCDGCGREITEVRGKPLPPQNHHQHTYAQGTIRWRLIACDE